MTFKEVGDILREERLRQNLSLDEVMHRTKVSRRHIIALEEGDVEDLPHPVYVKGFVKTYASVLGVDAKQFNTAVDEAFPLSIEDNLSSDGKRGPEIALSSGRRANRTSEWLVIILIILLLGGAGYGVWYYFFQAPSDSTESLIPADLSPQEATPAPTSAPLPIPTPTPFQVDQPAETPAEASSPETSEVSEAPETPEEQPAESSQASEEPSAETEPSAESAETQESTESAATDESAQSALPEPLVSMVIASDEARAAEPAATKVLDIYGKGECWIEAKVDGDFTTDFYVRQSERVQVRFVRNLAVKFGNIGEVALRYNGKEFGSEVPANGVKTLRFPPNLQ